MLAPILTRSPSHPSEQMHRHGPLARQARPVSLPPPFSTDRQRQVHQRLSLAFNGTIPASRDTSKTGQAVPSVDEHLDSDSDDETSDVIGLFRHICHPPRSSSSKPSITKPAPTSSAALPSYQRIMHAFTLNQMSCGQNAAVSTASPSEEKPTAEPSATALRLRLASGRLGWHEGPLTPVNTPARISRAVSVNSEGHRSSCAPPLSCQ